MYNYYKEITSDDLSNDEYIIDVINYNSVSIQPIGEVAFSLKGNISDGINWANISSVKLSDFSFATDISDNNIYSIDVSGLDFIKFVVSDMDSNAKINVKAV